MGKCTVDGGRTSLVRVDGLDGVRRLSDTALDSALPKLTKAPLGCATRDRASANAHGNFARCRLQQSAGGRRQLDDWAGGAMGGDRPARTRQFNSKQPAYDVSGALTIRTDVSTAPSAATKRICCKTRVMPAMVSSRPVA